MTQRAFRNQVSRPSPICSTVHLLWRRSLSLWFDFQSKSQAIGSLPSLSTLDSKLWHTCNKSLSGIPLHFNRHTQRFLFSSFTRPICSPAQELLHLSVIIRPAAKKVKLMQKPKPKPKLTCSYSPLFLCTLAVDPRSIWKSGGFIQVSV